MTADNSHSRGWTPVVAVPTYVTVAVPQLLNYKNADRFRGAQAKIRKGDAILINMSVEQGKLIRDTAATLGVPYAAYIRWCALIIARALHKERTDEELSIEL